MNASLKLVMGNASESAQLFQKSQENLPQAVKDWQKRVNDDYSDDNAYYLDGTGTDQDIHE